MMARPILLVLLAVALGCDRIPGSRGDPVLPPIETVREMYRSRGTTADIRYNGNVVELRVRQSASQLERGGSMWARVGPYIHLFTPGTRDVMAAYPAVSAVRAITTTGGREIARAMLVNDSLGTVQWRRAINLLGQALRDGSTNPVRLEELVRFGEMHTTHQYNPAFVPEQPGRRDHDQQGAVLP